MTLSAGKIERCVEKALTQAEQVTGEQGRAAREIAFLWVMLMISWEVGSLVEAVVKVADSLNTVAQSIPKE